MPTRAHRSRAPWPRLGHIAGGVVGAVAALLALAVLAGCAATGSGTSQVSGNTTPLGCPAGLPPTPLQASEAQLECTERALIARACDVRVDEGLQRSAVLDTGLVRRVDYRGRGRLQDAHLSYFAGGAASATVANLVCDTPGGGVATKRGNVQLAAADWAMIAAAGTELPRGLQPGNLELHHLGPPSTLAPAPTVLTPDPAGDACAARASEVFRRLATGQLTLAQARAQLPAKVPALVLSSELEGVKRLEADGASAHDAIDQASGTVAQSCQN